MKIVKLSFLLVICLMLTLDAHSQIKFGARVNLGTSWISSGNLKDNLEFQMNRDANIKEWSASYRPGTMIGIGGVAQYELTERLFLQGELSYNYQQSRIDIDYLEDDINLNGNGETEQINSEAKISSSRLSTPVTVHYSLGLDKPVLLAGLEANFLNTPQIESTESELVREFENGTLVASESDLEAVVGDLDIFNTTRFNFLLGVAKSVELAGNKILLQLTYHLPLSASEMYTFNNRAAFDDNSFRNNEVFGAFGKVDAEQDASAYPLNDFRMHFLDFSVTYLF